MHYQGWLWEIKCKNILSKNKIAQPMVIFASLGSIWVVLAKTHEDCGARQTFISKVVNLTGEKSKTYHQCLKRKKTLLALTCFLSSKNKEHDPLKKKHE